ncbi:MAG TPA: SBBP repeat-containing protein [Kofleriaceae bacterium]
MRVRSIALAALALSSACSGKSDPKKDETKPTESAPKKVVEKKPVDKAPLPPLAKDPGGATGTPMRVTGWGGLGIDAVRDVAVDEDGNVYAGGYFDADMDFGGSIGKRTAPTETPKKPTDPTKPASQAEIVKLGADGKIAWVDTWGGVRDDAINAVAVKGDTVVVAGTFLDKIDITGTGGGKPMTVKSSGSDDAIVVAYNKTGEAQWVWNIGGINSDGANTVAATPDGGWIVGGSFSDWVDFGVAQLKTRGGTDAMLIKLKGTGEIEWVKQFGGAYQDYIAHVAVDAKGNIIVQGQFKDISDWGGEKLKAGGGSDYDVVLAKYDLNGDHLWSQRFGNGFNDVAGGVTVDPAGFITMVGSFDKSASFGKGDDHTSAGESDIFVVRFSPDGELQWARTYGADREDIASGVATDANGNTVTTGWFQQTVDFGKGPLTSKGNKDIFALKLDVSGGVVWAQRFGDKDHDQGRSIALDSKGNAYLAGIYRFGFDTGVASIPVLQSARADGDRIPKPDAFVLQLGR